MNSAWSFAPFADLLYAGDFAWWRTYGAEVEGFTGERWTVSPRARDAFGLRYVRAIRNPQALRMRGAIYAGVNSGHNSVALAHLFGAALVILLGFDMQPGADGRRHCHKDHPSPMGNGGNFLKWRTEFAPLVAELAAAGTRIVNATRFTALSCCERMKLDAALRLTPPLAQGGSS